MSTLRVLAGRLAAIAAIAITASNASAAGTTLKWSIKSGETLKYSFIQTSAIKAMTSKNQEIDSKIELNVDMSWTGKSVAADGTTEVTMLVDRVRVRVEQDGQPIAFDSKDKKSGEAPETQVFAKIYEAVVGAPYTLKLSPEGDVVDVKVPEAVTAEVATSPFAQTADSGSLMTPAGLKNMLAQVFPKFPKTPVDAGSTWSTDIPLPAGLVNMKVKTDYTVGELAPTAKVSAKIDVAISTSAPKVTITLNSQSGTAKFGFDATAGHMIESTIRQSYDMTLTAGDEMVKQSVTINLALKLVK
jgi:hypothetical protein